MKILIACECSGAVRDEFIKLGHDAISCDLKPSENGGAITIKVMYLISSMMDLI